MKRPPSGGSLRSELRRLFGDETQADVAARLEISPQYLSDILLGRRDLSIEVALRLERRWHCKARDLLIRQLDEQIAWTKAP